MCTLINRRKLNNTTQLKLGPTLTITGIVFNVFIIWKLYKAQTPHDIKNNLIIPLLHVGPRRTGPYTIVRIITLNLGNTKNLPAFVPRNC